MSNLTYLTIEGRGQFGLIKSIQAKRAGMYASFETGATRHRLDHHNIVAIPARLEPAWLCRAKGGDHLASCRRRHVHDAAVDS